MKYEDLKLKVKESWPEVIEPDERYQLVKIEEIASEKMIGLKYELLYRNLSYSLLLYLLENRTYSSVSIDGVDWDEVKTIFENRIDSWTLDDDGFTSDINARDIYYKFNTY